MSKVEKENLVVKHNALINATSKYKYETNELKTNLYINIKYR